jgi:hypothetical protein
MSEVLGHTFTNFGSCEQICWDCGFVIPRGLTATEVHKTILELAGATPRCGGAWGKMLPEHIKCKQCGRNQYPKCEGGWLPPIGPCRDGSYITSRRCPNDQ